jgi:hypothetical protein
MKPACRKISWRSGGIQIRKIVTSSDAMPLPVGHQHRELCREGHFPAARRRLVLHPMAEIAVSSVTEGELCYAVRGNWKLRVCGPSSKNFSCG